MDPEKITITVKADGFDCKRESIMFTTTFIEKWFGIKRERLNIWLKNNYIKPSIKQSAGRGTAHFFSKNDLIFLKLFEAAINIGITRDSAAAMLRLVNDEEKFKFTFQCTLDKALAESSRIALCQGVDKHTLVFIAQKTGAMGHDTNKIVCSDPDGSDIWDDGWTSVLILNLSEIKREVEKVIIPKINEAFLSGEL